jgi:hypothetical protein
LLAEPQPRAAESFAYRALVLARIQLIDAPAIHEQQQSATAESGHCRIGLLSHQAGGATVSSLISGQRVSQRRIVIARMLSPKVNMSGKTGAMKGGLTVTAASAHLINQLLGKHVLSAGADLGDLSASVTVA